MPINCKSFANLNSTALENLLIKCKNLHITQRFVTLVTIYIYIYIYIAKNATKPNPFEIIPLQTTRKENNWKTEEVLARAAVTVETERIKGSNP